MTTKEQIKAIIQQYADKGERLLEEAYENGEHASTTGYWDGYGDCANLLLRELDDMQEESVILTEAILKKNGFELNPRPRYKEPFWSELFTAFDGRKYYFKINMEQRVETLMTIEPLATDDGHGHPTCYLPHPKTIQQLEKSLRLFNIKYIIKV